MTDERAEALKEWPIDVHPRLGLGATYDDIGRWFSKHAAIVWIALQLPECTVCKDDPIECGALPSLRHCPSAALDAERINAHLHFIKDVLRFYKGGEEIDPVKMPRATEALLSLDKLKAALSAPAWRPEITDGDKETISYLKKELFKAKNTGGHYVLPLHQVGVVLRALHHLIPDSTEGGT